ncbi:hypothetical protein KI387_017410, partial [Taxus chinensis]
LVDMLEQMVVSKVALKYLVPLGIANSKRLEFLLSQMFTLFELTKRENFMILGCDGLWGVFGPSDAVEFVARQLKVISWFRKLTQNCWSSVTWIMLGKEHISCHLIKEVEDAGNKVKAIDEWEKQIIHQVAHQFKEVPTSLETMHRALAQLKELMTGIEGENVAAERRLEILAKINSLPESVLIEEKLALDGSMEKVKQLEMTVSFRMKVLKHMLGEMQLLEDKMEEVSGSVISFFTEEVIDGVHYYTRFIPDKPPASLEEFLPSLQKKIDEAVIPFTFDSIEKLIRLHAYVKEFGPSLKRVKTSIDILSRELLRFKTESGVIAKVDGKTMNYMLEKYI